MMEWTERSSLLSSETKGAQYRRVRAIVALEAAVEARNPLLAKIPNFLATSSYVLLFNQLLYKPPYPNVSVLVQ